jgi:transposase-like protein
MADTKPSAKAEEKGAKAKAAPKVTRPLTMFQYIAGCALGTGMTQGEAAQKAGVNRRTVEKWIAESPAFRELIAEEQKRHAQRIADEIREYDIADKSQRVARRQERANFLAAALAELQERYVNAVSPSEAMQARIVQLMKLEIENETQVATELGQRIARLDLNQLSNDRLMELVGQVFNGTEDADPGEGEEGTAGGGP